MKIGADSTAPVCERIIEDSTTSQTRTQRNKRQRDSNELAALNDGVGADSACCAVAEEGHREVKRALSYRDVYGCFCSLAVFLPRRPTVVIDARADSGVWVGSNRYLVVAS